MVRRIAVALFAVLFAFIQPLRAAEPADAKPAGVGVTVPVFEIDGPLTESPAGEELPIFGPPPASLKGTLERMGKAAKDPAVKAVVVLSERGGVGPAQIEEIRQAIGDMRKAGKD